MVRIFKIASAASWAQACSAGLFEGAAIDFSDGFIHFSDARQVKETAARHFAGAHDLLLLAFNAEDFGDDLRWEVSRGGALFPHLYGTLDPAMCIASWPLPWTGTEHKFPEGWDT